MSHQAELERSFEDETWLAVWTYPSWERKVFRALCDMGLNPYLPRRWQASSICRGKLEHIDTSAPPPLFTGYCFVASAEWTDAFWEPVHEIDGVGGILCGANGIVLIPDMQLANPRYADILQIINAITPFRSNRWRKAERARQSHLAKLLAS